MAVGNQATVAQVNNTLTSLSVQLRETMGNILQQWSFLNSLGLTGLENLGGTGNGFSAADAQGVLDAINHMATVAQVYQGTATQATLFNFENSLTPLWAGQ